MNCRSGNLQEFAGRTLCLLAALPPMERPRHHGSSGVAGSREPIGAEGLQLCYMHSFTL